MALSHVKNDHLKAVFAEILPLLEGKGLSYWVYGGVGVAGIVGRFIRENQDVDVYVLEEEFDEIRTTLHDYCRQKNGYKIVDKPPLSGRRKFEVHKDNKELLSAIPLKKVGKFYEYGTDLPVRFNELDALHKVPTTIENYNFISAPDNVIKDILKALIEERPSVLQVGKRRRIDAEALFPKEQYTFWKQYEKEIES